jgi:phage terminase large subunit-like protein
MSTYNEARARHVVSFIEKFCVHIEGQWAGKPFILLDWQKEFIGELFGTLDDNGLRQYREAYIEIARKQGKSSLGAALALYMLVADGEYGAQVVSVAKTREQARIIFSMAAKMVHMSPALSSILEVQKYCILYPKTQSIYKCIAAEAGSAHGMNLHAVLYDELHTIEDGEMYDVLKSSMGARRQPLIMSFTTAGTNRNSFCYTIHEYAVNVKKGLRTDPRFLSRIFTLDEGDDWKDPANWHKACPSLGKTVQLSYLEDEYNRCRELPSYEVTFKTLYLCIWANAESIWISDDDWMACADPTISIEDFAGQECVLGCDLSAGDDLTAVTALFKRDDKTYIFPFFFIPDFSIAEMGKRNKADYIGWVNNGKMLTTQGKTTDHEQITNWIVEFGRKYKIKTVALDYLFEGRDFAKRLATENIHVTTARTNWKVVSEPTKDFEKLIRNGKLVHDNNPCMRWNVINAVLWKDANGNVRPDKLKSRSKIDGVMATVLALYMKDMLSTDDFDCFFTLPKITV